MDLRKNQRFPVHFRIFLMPPDSEEEVGTVMDLSLGGCRIKTERTVLTGVHLVLRLDVPGEQEPIRIERAAVRWSTGEECGVYFVTMGVRRYERLKQILKALEKQAE